MGKTAQQQKQVESTPKSKRMRNEEKTPVKINLQKTPISSTAKSPKILQLINQKFAEQNEVMTAKIEECVRKCINDSLKELKAQVDNLSKSVCQLSERVTKLENNQEVIMTLKTQIQQLDKQVAHQENINVSSNLRICGIPYANDENLHDTFKKLCAFFNIDVPYIKSVYRIKDRKQNNIDSVIMVKLFTSQERNALLRAISNYIRENKSLLPLHIIGFNVDTPFFVNEDLTNCNYKILQACLKLKRKKIIFSSFTLRGVVYIKCNNTDRPIRIESTEQLNNLFRCYAGTSMSAANEKGDATRQ